MSNDTNDSDDDDDDTAAVLSPETLALVLNFMHDRDASSNDDEQVSPPFEEPVDETFTYQTYLDRFRPQYGMSQFWYAEVRHISARCTLRTCSAVITADHGKRARHSSRSHLQSAYNDCFSLLPIGICGFQCKHSPHVPFAITR